MVLDKGDLINAANPYIVKTMADGLHVCLPTKVIDFSNHHIKNLIDSLMMSTMLLLLSRIM